MNGGDACGAAINALMATSGVPERGESAWRVDYRAKSGVAAHCGDRSQEGHQTGVRNHDAGNSAAGIAVLTPTVHQGTSVLMQSRSTRYPFKIRLATGAVSAVLMRKRQSLQHAARSPTSCSALLANDGKQTPRAGIRLYRHRDPLSRLIRGITSLVAMSIYEGNLPSLLYR